jgi:hypothetical protein
MTPRWISQLVPPMGAIKAEGIKNQLGRPSLDRFVVLVREAAQNSWDAADLSHDGPVRFAMDLRELDAHTASAWQRVLGAGAPDKQNLGLRPALSSEPLSILFVSDRGALGLGGPIRADEVHEGEPHDYVAFALNVGDPRDTDFGGGTYGFGKAVFFLASAASTILVHTRCLDEHGAIESRLVGCALGASFESDGHVYSGRHWFGLPAEAAEVVEPVMGDAADEIARELGFPVFDGDDLGTTIAVIAPELDDRSPEDVVQRLANSVLWHLWPKMVDNGDGPDMTFAVSCDGTPIEIPDPATHPVLGEFVTALRELDELGDTITYGAGSKPVGKILLRTTFAPPPLIDDVGQEAGLGSGVRHCCLLRVPELVVEYRAGPPLPDERVWYAGVFKVFTEHDETFARAEPPTHDSWAPEYLDDRDRSLVRVTLRKIEEKLRSHAAPRSTQDTGGAAQGLAALSRMLGGLIAPAPGQAADSATGKQRTGGRKAVVRMIGAPEWRRHDDRDVLVQPFEIDAKRQVTIDAKTTVRVWGGAGNETDPPIGVGDPRLVGWRDPEGRLHPAGRLAITPQESGRWEAIVASPADTVTRIRVHEATTSEANG